MRRRGLPAVTLATVTEAGRRRAGRAPRPASPSSGGRELDVELHEIALDLLGADAELDGAVEQGLAVLPVRPDLRRHQRDPAQHRRRAGAGAPRTMRFALTDDQVAFRDAVRDLLAKECPPAVVRAAWDGSAGRARPRRVGQPRRDGRARRARARGTTAASASTRPGSCPSSRRRAASPSRTRRRDGDGRRAASRGVGAGHGRHRRSAGPLRRRAPPTPTRSSSSRRRRGSLVVDRGAVDLTRRSTTRRPRSTRRPVSRPTGTGEARHRRAPTSQLAFDRGGARHRRAPGRARAGDARPHRRLRAASAQQFGVPVGSFQAVKHHLADAAAGARVRPARRC